MKINKLAYEAAAKEAIEWVEAMALFAGEGVGPSTTPGFILAVLKGSVPRYYPPPLEEPAPGDIIAMDPSIPKVAQFAVCGVIWGEREGDTWTCRCGQATRRRLGDLLEHGILEHDWPAELSVAAVRQDIEFERRQLSYAGRAPYVDAQGRGHDRKVEPDARD